MESIEKSRALCRRRRSRLRSGRLSVAVAATAVAVKCRCTYTIRRKRYGARRFQSTRKTISFVPHRLLFRSFCFHLIWTARCVCLISRCLLLSHCIPDRMHVRVCDLTFRCLEWNGECSRYESNASRSIGIIKIIDRWRQRLAIAFIQKVIDISSRG